MTQIAESARTQSDPLAALYAMGEIDRAIEETTRQLEGANGASRALANQIRGLTGLAGSSGSMRPARIMDRRGREAVSRSPAHRPAPPSETRLAFILAHLSDAHIGPLPHARRRDLFGKRITGYINWKRGRSNSHDMEVLAAVVTDLRDQKPSHVAMTGDILNLALPGEYPLAETWLRTLGEPGSEVSFVAGNHDAYTRGSLPTLARTFAPWTRSDDTGQPGYPYMKVRDGVALIGVCSGVPRAPFIASGRLGHVQREALERRLAEAGARGLFRVVMIHHPPRITDPGGHIGRGLADHLGFAKVIRRHGAELILHGHNHKLFVDSLPGPSRDVPVVGVPSASAIKGKPKNRAGYHLFTIEGGGADATISVRARGLLPGEEMIGDLGAVTL